MIRVEAPLQPHEWNDRRNVELSKFRRPGYKFTCVYLLCFQSHNFAMKS